VRAEITSKALAGILRASAAAPVDLEGLLFGRLRSAAANGSSDDSVSNSNEYSVERRPRLAVVERFLLAGPAWSLCTPQSSVTEKSRELVGRGPSLGMRCLGWCSIRVGCVDFPPSGSIHDSPMTGRETKIHKAISSFMTKGSPVLGFVQKRRSEVGDLGSFILDSACVAPSLLASGSLAPLDLNVRSLGSTSNKEAAPGSRGGQLEHFLPLPLLGSLGSVTDEIEAVNRRSAVTLFEKASNSLDMLCNIDVAGSCETMGSSSRSRKSRVEADGNGARLHRRQRENWEHRVQVAQASGPPPAKRGPPVLPVQSAVPSVSAPFSSARPAQSSGAAALPLVASETRLVAAVSTVRRGVGGPTNDNDSSAELVKRPRIDQPPLIS